MESPKKWITKNLFAWSRRCAKAAQLMTTDGGPEKSFSEAAYRKSQLIEATARELFPGGVDVAGTQHLPFPAFVDYTQELIAKTTNPVIYQACFQRGHTRGKVDILVLGPKKWQLYDVISRTRVEEEDILGLGFLAELVQACYPAIKVEAGLIHLNTDYVLVDQLDICRLFKIVDLTTRVRLVKPLVQKYLSVAERIIEEETTITTNIGLQCKKPYECPFLNHCWAHIPEPSVFEISRLWEVKKFKLYEQGIVHLQDLPRQVKLNNKQWLQVDSTLQKRVIVDTEAIHKFVAEVEYPLYFLDFETFQPPVPRYQKTKAYSQICFQYSLHRLDSPLAELKHLEFLAQAKGDFRLSFLQNLLTALNHHGTILAYNQKFEAGRLQELAQVFPEYESEISRVIHRMKDLMRPFEDRSLYHPQQKGSVSLKVVLPAWVPELSYAGLNIGNGVAASEQFEKLAQSFTSRAEKQQIRRDLLAYCKMDTYAMVRLWQVLEKIAQEYQTAA